MEQSSLSGQYRVQPAARHAGHSGAAWALPRNPRRFAGILALGAVAGIGACVCVAVSDPTTPGGFLPPCPTRALFGFTCPGCGSARMLYSLIHGDLGAAVHYNALAIIGLILVAWTVVALAAWHFAGKRLPRWEQWRWAPHALGAAMLGWMLIRNLPIEPFTALAV